ncbi:MAG: hypothetical protein A2X94_08785 [Bdellovibrionales bacterium GWB1_55_8]|nr:MAG: hypothetical protein A2X94_08785 [Bdellovibrionales bacterium GWB1_55_8]
MTHIISLVAAGVLVILSGTGGFGCGGIQNHPALEALQGNAKVDSQAFVEIYIEYPGPQEKWAGPTSFILHVLANAPGNAHISVTPGWFEGPAVKKTQPELAIRKPASLLSEMAPAAVLAPTAEQAKPQGLPSDIARDRMRYLANAIESGLEEPFRGCRSPVRIRIVRADGDIVERTGCRSEKGWPRAASEAVEFFMNAQVYGLEVAT